MMRAPIILLKEGTEESSGKSHRSSNIAACIAVADLVKTTLGPRGMDKLIHDDRGVTISNDGATIMGLLNVVHPTARLLTDISHGQDMEVGDGTTTVILLAAELLKEAKILLDDGVSVHAISRGFEEAADETYFIVQDIQIVVSQKSLQENMQSCAETAMTSKILSNNKKFFGSIVVDAVNLMDDPTGDYKEMIGIKKVPGGPVKDSCLIKGVAFKKTFSYAGFEQQPKTFQNPKVLLLNLELELKAEKESAEVRISSSEEYKSIVDAEWNIIYRKLDLIVKSGAQLVFSRLPVGDLATQYFADRNIFCAGRVEESDMARLSQATGGKVQTSISNIRPDVLGSCGLFKEMQIGADRYNILEDCDVAKAATIIVRGGSQQFLDEAERTLNDALMVARRAASTRHIVGGAGACEMEISRRLRLKTKSLEGTQQVVVSAFARALEVIPRTLASNSGFDCNEIMNVLRKAHKSTDEKSPTPWIGVDCVKGGVQDVLPNFVIEPALVKQSAISSATEVAVAVLSIDETVKNVKVNTPPGR
eukprot:GHVP01031797.1.p1 GENE.GHVP01031797.1~~GHVP01031797.1.p1  ORF type:complete len:535 (+),score=101.42 GHVP01031797.1:1531-3135(+)